MSSLGSEKIASKRRVLVVGSAGYIGPIIVNHLLSQGYAVRGLDRFIYPTAMTVVPFVGRADFDFVRGDFRDPQVTEKAFRDVTDVVVLAGLVGDPITAKYPQASQMINHDGLITFVRDLSKYDLDRVVFVSTCSNYGLIPDDALAAEDFELSPQSLYAKAKVAVEREILRSNRGHGYTPTVLRFATAFGLSPRMRFDLTISQFTRSMFFDEDLLVYDAHTWRPYCHLQDFAEVIRRVLEAPEDAVRGEVFNAGGDVNNFTKQGIIDAVLDVLPNAPVRYRENGPDPRNYRVSFEKIRSVLGFQPRYSVRDGIAELIAALEMGLFDDINRPVSFYGNYEIDVAS
jgi:nucleoside-diphosphate-sugar epimerase